MSDEDPLRHADVGETKTVRESVQLHTINYEPDVYHGSDRLGEANIENIEIVENEFGDEDIKITFEADLVKTVPDRWDERVGAALETDDPSHKQRLLSVLSSAVVVGFPVLLSWLVGVMVLSEVSGLTLDGETLTFDPFGITSFSMLAVVLLIAVAVRVIPRWGVKA